MTLSLVQIALLLLASIGASAQPRSQGDVGLYSRSAVSIWSAPNRLNIPSPNGKKAIVVGPPPSVASDANHIVEVRVNGHDYRTRIGSWTNAEVAWSPDSKAFFVTYSDGGNIGTYHVKVIYVTRSGLHATEPVPNGRKLLVPNCFSPERPNVGAIKWIGAGSSRLLIAVQVPPHSSCASMGTFMAFEIALPSGKVLSRYNQIEAKKMFANAIGLELQAADDDCIRRPETCIPPGLHLRRSQVAGH